MAGATPLPSYDVEGEIGVITLSREPPNTYDGALPGSLEHGEERRHAGRVMRARGKRFSAGAELRSPRAGATTASIIIGGIQSHLHTWFYGPRLAKEMIYSGMRLPAQRLYSMGQVNRLYPDVETLHRETMTFAKEIADQEPLPLRQAKRAADITMDLQGQHYVLSRMEELLDEAPRMKLRPLDQK